MHAYMHTQVLAIRMEAAGAGAGAGAGTGAGTGPKPRKPAVRKPKGGSAGEIAGIAAKIVAETAVSAEIAAVTASWAAARDDYAQRLAELQRWAEAADLDAQAATLPAADIAMRKAQRLETLRHAQKNPDLYMRAWIARHGGNTVAVEKCIAK